MSMPTSSSVMFSLTAIPCEIAFARMRSRLRPAPSSVTSMQMFPPWCSAERIRFPTGDLPAAMRFSGSSIPWSRLLRTRCVNGSIMRSIRLLSSSVELPIRVSSICLFSLLARSRTRRGKRLKTYSIGIIRMDMTDSCRSRALRCSWPMLVIRSPCVTGSSSLERWASIDWVITSSPTRLISWSTFSTATRILVDSLERAAGFSPRPGAAASFGTAFSAGAAGATAGAAA
ncbi:Uncharacterised protein [Enterobacter asburiae]|nr:Uncharacterised protein [Enterobacter asburiae]